MMVSDDFSIQRNYVFHKGRFYSAAMIELFERRVVL